MIQGLLPSEVNCLYKLLLRNVKKNLMQNRFEQGL